MYHTLQPENGHNMKKRPLSISENKGGGGGFEASPVKRGLIGSLRVLV